MTTASQHHLAPPAAGSHEAALLAFVGRCRRRARLLLFHRYLSAACAAVCLSSAAMLMSGVEYTVELGISAMAIAIAGSALGAFRFAPAPFRVAAEIDRRRGLDDCVVAALQVCNSELPVAPLVVRHAIGSVDRVTPAAVYPLDLRRSWFVAGAAALVLGIVAVYNRPSAIGSIRSSASDASSVVAGADSRELTGQRQPDGTAQPAATTPGAGDNQRPLIGDSGTDFRADAPRRAAEQQDSGSSAQATDSSSVRDGRPAAASPPSRPGTERVASAASGSAGPGASGRGGSGILEGAVAAGIGASGIGRGAGAGGVRGQRASGTAPEAAAPAPVSARSQAEYDVARARAGVAISRDLVPPDLRNYVRDYFIAIAPQTESR